MTEVPSLNRDNFCLQPQKEDSKHDEEFLEVGHSHSSIYSLVSIVCLHHIGFTVVEVQLEYGTKLMSDLDYKKIKIWNLRLEGPSVVRSESLLTFLSSSTSSIRATA